jgi:LysR family hydrogen peroxide-inducible transcriptional activator
VPVITRQLEVEPLFEEELHLLMPVGHPLESVKKITAESVDGYPFVMLNEAHCLSENVASFCRKQSVQPVTIERTSQLATVQELVTLNHGVSIVPEMARKIDKTDRRIYRSFSGAKPTRTIAMMWNPSRFQSKAMQALMQHLRQPASSHRDR